MARLFIVDPDGRGIYSFTFDPPVWLQVGMAAWMTTHKVGWPAWAGFLGGCEERMAEIKRREALSAPDPED